MWPVIESVLRAAITALCDMLRGGLFATWLSHRLPFSMKIPAMLVLAGSYVHLLGWSWWTLIFMIWLPLFSQIMGTGNPVGKLVLGHTGHRRWLEIRMIDPRKDWEKYQFTNNGWVTITWLGFIWSFGAVIVAVATKDWDWLWVSGAYTVSMPLAGVVVRHFFSAGDRWLAVEGVRSGVAMLITQAGIYLT